MRAAKAPERAGRLSSGTRHGLSIVDAVMRQENDGDLEVERDTAQNHASVDHESKSYSCEENSHVAHPDSPADTLPPSEEAYEKADEHLCSAPDAASSSTPAINSPADPSPLPPSSKADEKADEHLCSAPDAASRSTLAFNPPADPSPLPPPPPPTACNMPQSLAFEDNGGGVYIAYIHHIDSGVHDTVTAIGVFPENVIVAMTATYSPVSRLYTFDAAKYRNMQQGHASGKSQVLTPRAVEDVQRVSHIAEAAAKRVTLTRSKNHENSSPTPNVYRRVLSLTHTSSLFKNITIHLKNELEKEAVTTGVAQSVPLLRPHYKTMPIPSETELLNQLHW